MARRKDDGRRTQPERVGAVIATYLQASGLGERVTQASVITAWPRLVGPQVAAVTEALHVSANGTLFVAVATNPWMAELSLLEPQLLAAINAGASGPRVKKIRWMARR